MWTISMEASHKTDMLQHTRAQDGSELDIMGLHGPSVPL